MCMPGPNRQVLFVRHGQSLHNADKGSAGIDPALSDSGLVQSSAWPSHFLRLRALGRLTFESGRADRSSSIW
eukprot:s7943_g3.t1